MNLILDSISSGAFYHQGVIFQQLLGSGSVELRRGLNWWCGSVK